MPQPPRVFRFEVTAVHKYNSRMSRKIVCEARKCQILVRQEISLHPKAAACRKASRLGRVTPCAPQTRIRSPSGAHGVTRPSDMHRNFFVTVLARFFHYQHFDRFAARHEFETELRHERLLQSIRISMLPIPFIPFEINVEVAGEAGFVNDWNLKVRFQITSQSAKRLVHANELPGCKTV